MPLWRAGGRDSGRDGLNGDEDEELGGRRRRRRTRSHDSGGGVHRRVGGLMSIIINAWESLAVAILTRSDPVSGITRACLPEEG